MALRWTCLNRSFAGTWSICSRRYWTTQPFGISAIGCELGRQAKFSMVPGSIPAIFLVFGPLRWSRWAAPKLQSLPLEQGTDLRCSGQSTILAIHSTRPRLLRRINAMIFIVIIHTVSIHHPVRCFRSITERSFVRTWCLMLARSAGWKAKFRVRSIPVLRVQEAGRVKARHM